MFWQWFLFDREERCTKFGLAFPTMTNPAPAQDYRKNFAECVKELGLQPDPSYTHKLQTEGRVISRWCADNDAQQTLFNDCVARKASLAAKPSAKGLPRVSR
jgi:hypothetical protein